MLIAEDIPVSFHAEPERTAPAAPAAVKRPEHVADALPDGSTVTELIEL